MNILYNTYPVAFDCTGGGERQLLSCAAALQKQGIEIEFFNIWKPQFDRADLVHYYSVQGGSMNFCSYVKHRRLRLIISPNLWLTEKNKARFPLQEINDLLNLCDHIACNSQMEAEQLARLFALDRTKFSVVYNGVDESFAKHISGDMFRKKFGIDGPFILNVANIEPRKNQLNLARAAKNMGTNVVILGRIRDTDYYSQCISESQGHLKWLGHIDHYSDLLKSAYHACDIFALPSELETPGLSALEAAACGAKIVITKTGSTTEYFQNMVTYVDSQEADSIKNAIEMQLNCKHNNNLQQYVLKNYTWEIAAGQLGNLYNKLLKEGKV